MHAFNQHRNTHRPEFCIFTAFRWWFAYKASRSKSPQTTTETSSICRIWNDGYSRKHRTPDTALLFWRSHSLDNLRAFYQHTNNHHPKFWRWFVVVCLLFTAYHPKFWPSGDLWWFTVICGGFGVVCDGLVSFGMVCGGLSFSHTIYLLVLNVKTYFLHFNRSWCTMAEWQHPIVLSQDAFEIHRAHGRVMRRAVARHPVRCEHITVDGDLLR